MICTFNVPGADVLKAFTACTGPVRNHYDLSCVMASAGKEDGRIRLFATNGVILLSAEFDGHHNFGDAESVSAHSRSVLIPSRLITMLIRGMDRSRSRSPIEVKVSRSDDRLLVESGETGATCRWGGRVLYPDVNRIRPKEIDEPFAYPDLPSSHAGTLFTAMSALSVRGSRNVINYNPIRILRREDTLKKVMLEVVHLRDGVYDAYGLISATRG